MLAVIVPDAVSATHVKVPVFIEPVVELFIVTSALALPIVIAFVVIRPILIVAPALTVPVPTVAPILIVGAAVVFPVPILISPSLLACAPKSKSAAASLCASPILIPRFVELVALFNELPTTLRSPNLMFVNALAPICIICPEVPVAFSPIYKFPVSESKKLKVSVGVDVETCEVYNLLIVSSPCAVG